MGGWGAAYVKFPLRGQEDASWKVWVGAVEWRAVEWRAEGEFYTDRESVTK